MAALTEDQLHKEHVHHLALLLHKMRTENREAPVEYVRTAPDGYVCTGFRYAPPAEVAPRNERTGRWDAETGRIVYDDGTEDATAVTGPAIVTKKPRATPEEKAEIRPPKEPKAKPIRQRQGAPKVRMSPETDQRREKAIALYRAGVTRTKVREELHMTCSWLDRILLSAGITPESRRAFPTTKGEDSHNAKLTNEQVLEIFHSVEVSPRVAERYGISPACVRRIRCGLQWSHITGKAHVPTGRQHHGTAAD